MQRSIGWHTDTPSDAPAGKGADDRPEADATGDRRPTETQLPTGPAAACSMRGAPFESMRADRGAVSCCEADNECEVPDPFNYC
jgi:hypothetical protein